MPKPPRPRLGTMIIFIGILSFLLYISNLVVYDALAAIFTLNSSELIVLSILLAFLSGSFIASTLLGMRYYNVFTRWYYFISAVWIGFFFYLFLASSAYGLLFMILGQSLVLGKILIAFGLVISIYGVVHARSVFVLERQVSLENLPEKWRGRKAVWISDLHLGQLIGSGFAKKVVEKVNSLSHDIIFIGGDLYDGTGAPDITELTAPLKGFSAKLGTYFITGNHEEFGDSTAFISAVKEVGIITLIDQMIEIDGMQIIGVDYHNASNKERFKNILSGLSIKPDKPAILLKHEPKDVDVAHDIGISLQISGHTHRAQLWPLVYFAQWVYKGFAYDLKNIGKTQVFTSSGVGTWGPPMRVGSDCQIVVFTFV